MAKKRICAYFMHEHELAEAQKRMTNVDSTDSYLVGEIEENEIAELEKKGLIVQKVDVAERQETPTAELARSVGLRSARVAAAAPTVAPPTPAGPVYDPNQTNFYLLQIDGPLLPKYRQQLQDIGVKLSEKVGRGTYVIKLDPAQISPVKALPFVIGLTLYGSTETELAAGSMAARSAAPLPQTGSMRMLTFDVQLHDPADLQQVVAAINARGLQVAGAKGRKIRFYVLEDANLDATITALRAIPQVNRIEPYVEPELNNDIARILLGLDPEPGSNLGAAIPLSGAGQIVGVADTGLDNQHPDFQGRIIGLVALGRPGDPSDPHGHGTHVAASVLGSGAASGGKYRGVAPGAQLYFQSLLDTNGRLGGLPLDLSDLFEDAYQGGARIHNNSWGAVVDSEYTMNSLEVDEFVARRRDMLIVVSAGNEGQAAQRLHAQQGFVDWLSIGAPASCKNALTVGASRSNRGAGGYSMLTYGLAWPDDFPQAPIAAEKISGNPNALAAFSSRGPCTDHRIKPDVVAPGTDILSAKSSRAPLQSFWGPGPSPQYAYMGGTSMAAPLVSGCAALVREYYVNNHHNPSAALLKATLINSTQKLAAIDAIADYDVTPNMHQGFGCIYMPFAVPNPIHPQLGLEFVDNWEMPAEKLVRTGQFSRFQVSVVAGMRLSICLVWTDPPGRGLQNNLNLIVEPPGGASKITGNSSLPMALGPFDQENNVELVRIENPVPGSYRLQVAASNLLAVDQDFALVVTGALTSGLVPVA
jgi:serine protease AprX